MRAYDPTTRRYLQLTTPEAIRREIQTLKLKLVTARACERYGLKQRIEQAEKELRT